MIEKTEDLLFIQRKIKSLIRFHEEINKLPLDFKITTRFCVDPYDSDVSNEFELKVSISQVKDVLLSSRIEYEKRETEIIKELYDYTNTNKKD